MAMGPSPRRRGPQPLATREERHQPRHGERGAWLPSPLYASPLKPPRLNRPVACEKVLRGSSLPLHSSFPHPSEIPVVRKRIETDATQSMGRIPQLIRSDLLLKLGRRHSPFRSNCGRQSGPAWSQPSFLPPHTPLLVCMDFGDTIGRPSHAHTPMEAVLDLPLSFEICLCGAVAR